MLLEIISVLIGLIGFWVFSSENSFRKLLGHLLVIFCLFAIFIGSIGIASSLGFIEVEDKSTDPLEIGTPIEDNHAATKSYVDSAIEAYHE